MKSRTKLIVISFSLAGLVAVVTALLLSRHGSNQALSPNTFSFTPVSAKRERLVTNRTKNTFVIPFDSVSGPWIEVDSNSGSGWQRLPKGRFAVEFMTKSPGDGFAVTVYLPPDAKEWRIGLMAEKVGGNTSVWQRSRQLRQTWLGAKLIPDFAWDWVRSPEVTGNLDWSDSSTLDSIPKSNKAFEITTIRELLQQLAKAKTTRTQLQEVFHASYPQSDLSYYNRGSPNWQTMTNIYGNNRINSKLPAYFSFVLCHSENVTAWIYLRNDNEVNDFDIVDEEMELPAASPASEPKRPNQN